MEASSSEAEFLEVQKERKFHRGLFTASIERELIILGFYYVKVVQRR